MVQVTGKINYRVGNVLQLTGHKFNRWTVLGRSQIGSKNGSTLWACQCECGTLRDVIGKALVFGSVKSCGCFKLDVLAKRCTTHGKSKSPEFSTWVGIIKRIENKKEKAYPDYGGRGIQICERWRNSFLAFLDDMGKKPGPGYSIERDNVNGNYEPGNCRWATKIEQMSNTRRTVILDFRGAKMTLAQFARMLGRGHAIVRFHLGKGMSVEEIFNHLGVRD